VKMSPMSEATSIQMAGVVVPKLTPLCLAVVEIEVVEVLEHT
jgi:hypothetical protein